MFTERHHPWVRKAPSLLNIRVRLLLNFRVLVKWDIIRPGRRRLERGVVREAGSGVRMGRQSQ